MDRAIEAQCKAGSQEPNGENMLSRVRMMLSAIGDGDTLAGLTKAEIQKLGFEIDVEARIGNVRAPMRSPTRGLRSECLVCVAKGFSQRALRRAARGGNDAARASGKGKVRALRSPAGDAMT
jgi:hypothetical protein